MDLITDNLNVLAVSCALAFLFPLTRFLKKWWEKEQVSDAKRDADIVEFTRKNRPLNIVR